LGHSLNTDVLKCVKYNIHQQLIGMLKNVEIYYDKETIMTFIHHIQNRFAKALAEPGDMVGIIAACCLGESATQATLNSFHSAGKSSKAVTTGVPRLEEILLATKNPKTPSMTIFIKTPEYLKLKKELSLMSTNYDAKRKMLAYMDSLRSTFEYTILNDVAKNIEIFKRSHDVQTNIISLFAKRVKVFDVSGMWWCDEDPPECIIVIEFIEKRLFELRLTTHQIASILMDNDGFGSYKCFASPNHYKPSIVIYPNFDIVRDKFVNTLEDKQSKININNWHY